MQEASSPKKNCRDLPACELQDVRYTHAETPAKSRRLDGQDRPERCIAHDFHCSGGPRILQVPMERQVVPVQLPAVRADLGSVGLYQDHSASRGDPAGVGPDHLHRRYPSHGGDKSLMSWQWYTCWRTWGLRSTTPNQS